jgi:hypothetical protein
MKSAKSKSLTLGQVLKSRFFLLNLAGFIGFHIIFYSFLVFGHGLVPFDRGDYVLNSHHYALSQTQVLQPHRANLLHDLGPYDGQFYLKLSGEGYSRHPVITNITDKSNLDAPSYAFSPAYPLVVAVMKLVFRSVYLSAFITSLVLLLIGFCSVYWLVAKWYDQRLAARTAWLVFLYPFSIFYRAYFAEGLFLILVVVLLDALASKHWARAALSAGWLTITRFVGVISLPILAAKLLVEHAHKRVSTRKLVLLISLSILPLGLFMLVCYRQSGDPFYFLTVRKLWKAFLPGPLPYFFEVVYFPHLSWHTFHLSQVDVISITIFGALAYFSRKWLPKTWWYVGLGLWLFPFLTHDTMSASRFQIVNLPLFIYAAHRLPKWGYRLVLAACVVGLAYVSIHFVNWYWIG